ncbi:hypothetical protein JST56_07055 [Candidatus Dependentiae bacterium]|nr:hypothetical protein [Candidatus Dependentiae bacterium]
MKRLLTILLFLPLLATGQYYMGQKAAGGGGGLPTTNLWGDYNAALGVTQSANRVSSWANQSAGAGSAAVQATGGAQPLWDGTSKITFTGSRADKMVITGALTTEYTIYAVVANTITTNGDGAFQIGDDNGSGTNLYAFVTRSSGVNNWKVFTSTGSITNTTSLTNGTHYMLKVKVNGASPNSYATVNSAVTTGSLGTTSTATNLTIGYLGTNSSSFVLERLIIYRGAHNESSVASYLTSIYGVP